MPLRTLLQRAPKHLRPRGAQHVIRRRPIRTLAALAIAAVLASVVVVALPAQAEVWSPFTQVYNQNAHGNIAIVGNTVVTCKTGTTDNQGKGNTCANAQSGTTSPWVNNNFTSQYVDVDGTSNSTFDSSSSTLTIPTDGAVLYAELVWGGRMPNGSTAAGADQSQRGTVQFTTPDGTPHTLAGAVAAAPASGTAANPYQGSYDVTSLVAAAGSGSYTVANVQTLTGGTDQYGGWALVVAYSDPAEVERNLTIYKGFANISNATGSTTQDLTFDGFTTPPNGSVKTELGFVTYEGDRGTGSDIYTGDSVDIKGSLSSTATPVKDARNPQNDVFNSTIGRDAVDSGVRNPKFDNQMGFDADIINADGALKNNETSATVTLKTGGETYYPGIVTFATQLYDPQLNGTKSAVVQDANNDNTIDPGDIIDYSVHVQNDGLDAATASTFFDAIPTGTTYVANSLTVDSNPVSDVAGDDSGEFVNSPIGHVIARFGTGASKSSGGVVQPFSSGNEAHTIAFKVQIAPSAVAGQQITNTADLSYRGATTGAAGATATNLTINVTAGGTAGPTAPNRVLAFDPTASAPSLTIDLAGQVKDGTPKTTTPHYDVIATTDAAGGTVTDNHDGTVTYTPRNDFAGRDVFTYTVADANGATSTATVKIDVQDDAPVAVNDTANVSHTLPTTIDAAANDTDANGDPLTVYSVTANGNSASEGQPGISLADGATVAVVGGKIVYTPPTSAPAGQTDTFTYLVQDSRGARSVDPGTVTVTLKNSPPVANDITLSTTKNATSPASINPLPSDSDPDSDSITVTGVGTPVNGGTATFTPNSVSYVPKVGYAGPDSFSYTIKDSFGGTSTATVKVTVDGPPTANPDAFSASGGSTAVTGNVITDSSTGDTDPNGKALTLTQVTPSTLPAGSSLAWQPDGSVALTVPKYWVGTTAPVSYTISNGTYTASSTVTFTVQNIAPTAPTTGTTTASYPDAGGTVDLFALVTDPNVKAGYQHYTLTGASSPDATVHDNGDGTVTVAPTTTGTHSAVLTYVVTDGVDSATSDVTIAFDDAPTAQPLSASIPTNGTDDVDAAGSNSDPDGDTVTLTNVGTASIGTATLAGGKVHYQPPTGYTGTATIPYTVSDGTKSASGTITVTVTDAPPTAVNDSFDIGHRGTTPLPVTDNDTDPNQYDGTTTDPSRDPITVYSATSNGKTITEGQSLTTAGGGTLTLKNGQLTYTAPAGGLPTGTTETFTYVPQDSHGTQGAPSGPVTLTSTNRTPTAADGSITVLKDGAARSLTPTIGDPDGDPVTITSVSAPTKNGGTVSFTGSTVTYTPKAGYAGSDSFTYTVSDGQGGTATGTVTVKVDGPPAANPVTYTANGSGSTVVLSGNIITDGHDTDPNGDAVTLTSVTPQKTPSAKDGTLSFTSGGNVSLTVPAGYVGTQVFDYSVTDGTTSATSTATFTVNNITPVVATGGTASVPSGSGGTVDPRQQVSDPNVDGGYQTLTTTTVSADHGATATIQPDGTVKVVPAPGYTGPITLTFSVSDGVATVSGTMTVNSVNGHAPVTSTQTVHTATDTAADVDVAASATDQDGDTVTLKSIGTPQDGTTPTGTATIVNGKLHYSPPTGYAGTVTIPYTVTDGTFDTSSTLTVVVDDAAPVAHPDSATAADYREVTTTDVLANDTDANIPGTSQVLTIASAAADHGATVAIAGSSLRVTPATGYRGTVTVDYVVSDGAGGNAVGRLTVTVGSASAVLSSSQTALVSTGGPVTVDLLAGSSSPNGALTVASVGPAVGADGRQHGTVTQNGSSITITPARGYTGALAVSFTVTDSTGVITASTIRMSVTAADGGVLAHTGVSPAPLLALIALLLGSASALLEITRRRQLRPEARHLV